MEGPWTRLYAPGTTMNHCAWLSITRLITLVKPSATAIRPTKQCVAMMGVSLGMDRRSGRRCSPNWYEARSIFSSAPRVSEPQICSTTPPISVASRDICEYPLSISRMSVASGESMLSRSWK